MMFPPKGMGKLEKRQSLVVEWPKGLKSELTAMVDGDKASSNRKNEKPGVPVGDSGSGHVRSGLCLVTR